MRMAGQTQEKEKQRPNLPTSYCNIKKAILNVCYYFFIIIICNGYCCKSWLAQIAQMEHKVSFSKNILAVVLVRAVDFQSTTQFDLTCQSKQPNLEPPVLLALFFPGLHGLDMWL